MAELKITLVKSTNSANKNHCLTVMALGLHRIGQSTTKTDTQAIRGMVRKVAHLVTCEEV